MAIAVGAVAAIATGCIGGERLIGPTIAVRNDRATAVLVRIQDRRFEVAANSTQALYPAYSLSQSQPADVIVIDAAACAEIGTVKMSFAKDLDPLVAVPPDGLPVQRARTPEERRTASPGPEAFNACPAPGDGWTVSVHNATTRAVRLAVLTADGVTYWQGHATAATTRTLRLPAFQHAGPGTIIILGPDCRRLAEVEHPEWGTAVATISDSGAGLRIEPGRVPPGDDAFSTYEAWPCPTASSPPSGR